VVTPSPAKPAPAAPPRQPPAPAPAPASPRRITFPTEALTATAPVRLGDVELRLKTVEVGGIILLEGGTERATRNRYLLVRLAVRNLGAGPSSYRRPHTPGPAEFGVSLADEHGNALPLARFADQEVKGQQQPKPVPVPPQAEIEDVLVFARHPLGQSKHLTLTLPVNSFDAAGVAGDPNGARRIQYRLDQEAIAQLPPLAPGPSEKEAATRALALARGLRSKQPDERIRTAEALAALGPQAIAAGRDLCATLLDADPRVRVSALDALQRVNLTIHKVVGPLLLDPARIDRATLTALADLGPDGESAVPVLLHVMEVNTRNGVFQDGPALVETLVKVAAEEAAVTDRFLDWLLDNPDRDTRVAAARSLPQMKDADRDAEVLATALQEDTDADVRLAAVVALGELGVSSRPAIQALTAAKTDPAAPVREAAWTALPRVERGKPEPAPDGPPPPADPETAAVIVDLKSKALSTRLKAMERLAGLGAKGRPAAGPLCEVLFDAAPAVRSAALEALRQVNPDLHRPVARLLDPLTETELANPGRSGRGAAVRKLGRLGPAGKPAAAVLIFYKQQLSQAGAMKYPIGQHVRLVVAALAKVAADDPAVTKLLAGWLAQEPEPASRVAVARALAKMKDGKDASAALAVALRSDPEAQVRVAAAQALGQIGSEAKGALQALAAARTDPANAVRQAAQEALAKIGRP
jgi:HEAT repeat protein